VIQATRVKYAKALKGALDITWLEVCII
jgi:hypothetical protein